MGPSIWFSGGKISVSGKPLMDLPERSGVDVEIGAGLGPQSTGAWDLVIGVAGRAGGAFSRLPVGNSYSNCKPVVRKWGLAPSRSGFFRCFGFADGACPLLRTVNSAPPWKKGTGTSRLLFSPQFQPIFARSQSPFSTTRLQFEVFCLDNLRLVNSPSR